MEESLRILFHWIKERESIRLKKEAGEPKPWTTDPILQSYRFCNVHREHDTVTRWIRNHWTQSEHPNFVLAMAMARFINWPDTLQDVGFPHVWEPWHIKNVMNSRGKYGHKVWTSAYIVSTNGRKSNKVDYIVDEVLGPLAHAHIDVSPKDTLASMHKRLIFFSGIGTFMSGQIIADLKNTIGCPLNDAPDFSTWCTPGPGSLRGANRIIGRLKEAPITNDGFLEIVNKIQKIVAERTDIILHAQDMQNCLCEFDKYMRVKNAEGRPRQSYPGV
jgi:hypothetical protein